MEKFVILSLCCMIFTAACSCTSDKKSKGADSSIIKEPTETSSISESEENTVSADPEKPKKELPFSYYHSYMQNTNYNDRLNNNPIDADFLKEESAYTTMDCVELCGKYVDYWRDEIDSAMSFLNKNLDEEYLQRLNSSQEYWEQLAADTVYLGDAVHLQTAGQGSEMMIFSQSKYLHMIRERALLLTEYCMVLDKNYDFIYGNEKAQPDNVAEIDLNLPENSEYLKYSGSKLTEKIELSDGRTITAEHDTVILTDGGGSREIVSADRHHLQYILLWNMIDENRFCYVVCNEESTDGFGIYDLSSEEDRFFAGDFTPMSLAGDTLILEESFISSLRGFGKMNLNDYSIESISLPDSQRNWCGAAVSPDLTKIAARAFTDSSNGEYAVDIYSASDGSLIESYTFASEKDFVNHQTVWASDSELYVFMNTSDKNSNGTLYIIKTE